MKSPIEKSVTAVIETPYETVVVIDMDRLEREVLKGAIADEDVQRLLPFQTKLGVGHSQIHIVNASAYTVETNSHFIREGETLCKRQQFTPEARIVKHATCPGCLAKAKSVIVNHTLGDAVVR